MKRQSLALVFLMVTSCATPSSDRDRVIWGAGIGGVLGASSGAALSPNNESRGLNALVFGVTGALVGGLFELISHSETQKEADRQTLEQKDSRVNEVSSKEYVVTPASEIPAFLKDRVNPVVVEEYTEQDSVSEDGSLHEPHKVYRIKHQAELMARPKIKGSTP